MPHTLIRHSFNSFNTFLYSVHTTCYSDVLHSLLNCTQYYKEWNLKFGMHGGSANDVFMQERRRWSIVSKSSRGVYLLDADLKREFRTEGIVPNTWIWPDRMSVYLHMVPEEEVDYNKRGPGAYDALASGKVPSSFRGLPVYTSYPLDVDFNGRPISLLDRDRQIGEWTYITPEDAAIWIYSADVDRFVKITYDEAERAALNRLSLQPTTPADDISLGSSKPASGRGKNKKPATTTQGTSTGSSGSKPSILIFRPFQTWTMSSAILCRAGSELGNTWHGHHDMQLQNDAIRKISKCPKNFLPLSRFFPVPYRLYFLYLCSGGTLHVLQPCDREATQDGIRGRGRVHARIHFGRRSSVFQQIPIRGFLAGTGYRHQSMQTFTYCVGR